MKKIIICICIIILIITGILFGKNILKNKVEINNLNTLPNKNSLLLYIDEIKNDDDNIVVTGKIISGKLNVNDEISIIGLGEKEVITKAIRLNVSERDTDSAKIGEIVSITIEPNIDMEYIHVGMAVITPQTDKPIYNIKVKISESTMELEEVVKKVNTFYINTDIKCTVNIVSKENNEIKISLDVPIIIPKDLEISLKNNDKVIAKGIVTE